VGGVPTIVVANLAQPGFVFVAPVELMNEAKPPVTPLFQLLLKIGRLFS